jgi:prepilin-type N-terminal cleavage/methylation domain-containing protein
MRINRASQAFSLLEMMVAVTLLTVIISALLGMFYQTQRAFRQSATQTDVLEGGRASMELMTSELSEISPSYQIGQLNLYASTAYSLIQPRPSPAAPRLNLIQDIFFLRRHNDDWIGTGYFVLPLTNTMDPIGTLYRFEMSTNDPGQINKLFLKFLAETKQYPPYQFSHRIIDRVVNLLLTPYDTRGQFLTNLVDISASFTNSFTNNVLPGYLDLELGIFEPRAYERYKALAELPPPRAFNYLSNHVEKVHLFRQRVPVPAAVSTFVAVGTNIQWIVP